MEPVRVRFAPSPTGYLHVGGARTALFNWLFARHEGGVFVLRIEDTDRARSDEAMTGAILDGLSWLGLGWDEGPLHQADGVERHRADGRTLLERGRAYRCFCTKDVVDARLAERDERARARGYDRHCRSIERAESERRAAAGEPFALRFDVPAGTTGWDDAVHGRIVFDNTEIEDFVVLRSDATPVYNLAVVSDDIAMRISHVIRGDDHISNTPKQILIYEALEARLPTFAHVPMILGPDGKRLSKRHGATSIGEYRALGILPDALFNFLALLGWSPGADEEILSRDELIRRFTLDGINKKSALFDPTKLRWMNGQYLMRMSAEELESPVIEALTAAGFEDVEARLGGRDRLLRWIELFKIRARSIEDIATQAAPYLGVAVSYDQAAVAKHWKHHDVADRLATLRERLAQVEPWDDQARLERAVREHAESSGIGAGKLIHPLRVALTGQSASPGIFDVLALLGRERSLDRIDAAIETLRQGVTSAG